MGKPMWLRILQDTIGFPSIIAVIVGVPAMIIFIQTIWTALSYNQRVITVVTGILIIFAIIWFVYSRTKKTLYVISKLLLKMNERTLALSSKLSFELSQKDFGDFITLTNIDQKQIQSLMSSIPDVDSLLNSIPELLKLAEDGTDKTKTDKDAMWRVLYFVSEKIGLKKALDNDKVFVKTKWQLDKIQIPNVEIRQSILDYQNASLVVGAFSPLLRLPMENAMYQKLLPVTEQVDSAVKTDEQSNRLKLLLSKVIETIDKYYKEKKTL